MSASDEAKKVLDFGVRTITMGEHSAKWCVRCDAFVDRPDDHATGCPYIVLASLLAENEALARRVEHERITKGETELVLEQDHRNAELKLKHAPGVAGHYRFGPSGDYVCHFSVE